MRTDQSISNNILMKVTMKNLFDSNEKERMVSRIVLIRPDQHALWGSMSLQEMLDHCSLALETDLRPMREELYRQPCPELGNASRQWAWLDGEASKLNSKILGKMTRLINLIKRFDTDNVSKSAYPFLGEMIYKEMGESQFIHLNHHLRQFGK